MGKYRKPRKKPEVKPDRLEDMENGLNRALRKRGIFLERKNFAMRGQQRRPGTKKASEVTNPGGNASQ